LIKQHYCLTSEASFVVCLATGPSDWVEQLEDEFAKTDDVSKQLVNILRNTKGSLDWLSTMRAIE